VVRVASGIPVLMSGGPLREKPIEFLQDVKNVMDAGARGVVVGRNVFQSKNPGGMIRAIMAIVHEGREPEEVIRFVE
jgi:class I fructose-bisphosphate aldolase